MPPLTYSTKDERLMMKTAPVVAPKAPTPRAPVVPQPSISATALTNPPETPRLREPVQPTIPSGITSTVKNMRGEVQNIIQADTEESRRLQALREEQASFGFSGQDLFNQQLEQGGVNTNLKELKDINLQLADMQTGSELTKTRIAGAEGQTLAQGQRELTQEDREASVRQMGLAARAAVLTDNINTATQLARDTANFAYQDQQLALTNRQNQINDLRQTADAQTQQLLDAEALRIEQEQAALQEVKANVSAAILAGASQAEVTQLTDPNIPDEQKLALAQSIQAREARTDIQLNRANVQSQIGSRNLANTIELAKLGSPEALASLGITVSDGSQPTSDELAYAQQYASTGKIPTGLNSAGINFGRISELARDLPKQDGTVVDATTGVKPDVSDATIEGYAAMYDLIKKSEELAKLNEQRTKGIAGGVAKLFGSDLQQQYADLRTEMVDLLARARTGAALTADEERFYKARLPGTMAEWGSQVAGGLLFGGPLGVDTTARIRDNFGGALEQTLNSKLQAQNLVIHGFTPVETSQGTFRVGEVITNEVTGQSGIINADGTVTPI